MTASIPISKEVTVIPGVVGTGGNPLSLNSIFFTQNDIAPAEALLSYSNATDVGDYFGTTSAEYAAAVCYFAGFENASALPGTLYFYGYKNADSPAWLRGLSLAGQPLSYYQALTGSLSIVVTGVTYTAASLNLSGATSIGGAEGTSVVNKIKTGLGFSGAGAPTIAWDSVRSQFVITSGTLGSSANIAFATGTLADPLALSAGILSQGVNASTPTTEMDSAINLSTDWATFTTLWEPTNSDAIEFAQWTQAQNDRYAFIAWDSDTGNKVANNSATIGALIAADEFDGTLVVYAATGGQYLAAAVAGYAAAINWKALNGRATLKFRQQAGLSSYVSVVNNVADANAILSNNATYFGTYAAPGIGNAYNIFADGAMNGSRFKWFDTYIGQIYLNSQLALAIFEGLLQVNMAPYNELGYNLIRQWCADPITEALNCGIIRSGVSLSNSQKSAINYTVGKDISVPLQTQGYFLNIADADAQTRGQRKSPPVKLYYMDGGAIQQITLNSIVVL
jgi:hypothetical protein